MRLAYAALLIVGVTAISEVGTGVFAIAGDSTEIATQLGSVLAAEQFCGLSYDQTAIQAFIEKHVQADDMGFPSLLEMMTGGAKVENRDLSASGKTAHCAQMGRIAHAYGFTK